MSLTNPTSADHIAAEAGSFEPQRSNNFSFEVALSGADRDIIVMSLQATTIPGEKNDEIALNYQNEVRYVAGKYTVDAGSVTLRDYVDVDTRGAVLRWRLQVYDPATGKIGLAKDYKKTAYIVMTAPDGSGVRVAKMKGCWPTGIGAANLSMEQAGEVLIEVPLRFDKLEWDL